MAEHIVKSAVIIESAGVQLADRIANAVAPITGSMRVAGIGRFGHEDANVFSADWRSIELYGCDAAFPVGYFSVGERSPLAFILFVHRVPVTHPILDLVVARVRFRPS